MAAKKKSASKRSAAKTRSKKVKPRAKAKKAGARKQLAKPRKAAARKKAAPATRARARAAAPRPRLPSAALTEIDQRIAIVRNNLRDLMEQAAATLGSATEELLSDRVSSAEAELQRLGRERDALAKREGS